MRQGNREFTTPGPLATGEYVKVAVRRAAGYPVGVPAPMHLPCLCGVVMPDIDYPDGPDVTCPSCARRYSATGWIRP